MPWWLSWVLVPLVAQAQSGDLDPSSETQIDESERPVFCTAHISTHTDNSLTCSLVGVGGSGGRGGGGLQYREDDDEDREDSIESIAVCAIDSWRDQCWTGEGGHVYGALNPVQAFNVTFQLRGGAVFSRIVSLREIVKPRSPLLQSAAFHPQNDQAVIHIKTPYHDDYLKPSNQLFEYHIWSTMPNSTLTQNVTGAESLLIEGEYLNKNTEYQVKVRAIPSDSFKGTWSDWSQTARFYTNSTKQLRAETEDKNPDSIKRSLPIALYDPLLILVISVPMVIVIVCFFVVWRKKRIHAYMAPSVPATLAPFYRQVKPDVEAMSFKPEQFSQVHIQPMNAAEEPLSSGESRTTSADASSEGLGGDLCLDWELSAAVAAGPGGRRWTSTSDSSTFTGESASTLLSFQSSSADGMYSQPRSRSQSPSTVPPAEEGGRGPSLPGSSGSLGQPDGPEVNSNGPTQRNRDAVYVTMSSFYQGTPERPQDGH